MSTLVSDLQATAKVSTEDLKKLQEIILTLQSDTQLTNLKSDVEKCLSDLAALDVKNIHETLSNLTRRLEDHTTISANEVVALQHVVSSIRDDLDNLKQSTPSKSELDAIENTLGELQDSLKAGDESITLEKLKSLEDTISSLPTSREILAIRETLSSLQTATDIETLKSSLKLLPTSDDLANLSAVIGDIQSELGSLQAEHTKFISVDSINEIADNLKELEGSTLEYKNVLLELQTKLDQLPNKFANLDEFKNLLVQVKLLPRYEELESLKSELQSLEGFQLISISTPAHEQALSYDKRYKSYVFFPI